MSRHPAGRGIAAAVLGALALAAPGLAHQGPPYPVLVDRVSGPYTLSVWADPDVGVGTFFVQFERKRGGEELRVAVTVQPSTGRLPPARSEARRQPDGSYKAEVSFDREEPWRVQVAVAGGPGSTEVDFEVAVTPPGYGAWDLVIYLAPFLVVGAAWAWVALKRRGGSSGTG